MIEEWRDVKGYEGYYQVSNLGNVKSLDRVVSTGRYHGRVMKYSLTPKGYKIVWLTKNSKRKGVSVHRLVALAFVSNPENKPIVNHLDEDKANNRFDNLEWVTNIENMNYGTRNERIGKANSIPIKVIYQDNTYEIWQSASLFAREFKVNASSINNALNGRMKTYKGMKFEYA